MDKANFCFHSTVCPLLIECHRIIIWKVKHFEITIITWHYWVTLWHFNKTQDMHHKREKENRSSFLLSRDQQKCPWMIEKGIKATYENTLILQVACLDCEKLVQLSKSQWGVGVRGNPHICNYCPFIKIFSEKKYSENTHWFLKPITIENLQDLFYGVYFLHKSASKPEKRSLQCLNNSYTTICKKESLSKLLLLNTFQLLLYFKQESYKFLKCMKWKE